MTPPTSKSLRFIGGFVFAFFGAALYISPGLDGPVAHWLKAAVIGVLGGIPCHFLGERAWKWIVHFVDF